MGVRTVIQALGVAAVLVFSTAASAIEVTEAWIMTPPQGASEAAAYVSINGAGSDDILLSVSCACAARAELHEMAMTGSMMTMRPLHDGAAVPANGLHMGPHGVHIMLIGLTQQLHEGDQVQLSMRFAEAGLVTTTALVRRR